MSCLRKIQRMLLLGGCVAHWAASGSSAQDSAPQSQLRTAPLTAQPPPDLVPSGRITRLDLGSAYLDFDRAVAEHAPQGQELAELNRGFDSLTRLFFEQRLPAALAAMRDLTAGLEGTRPTSPSEAVIGSLRARFEPPVWTTREWKTPPFLKVRPLYEVALEEDAEVPLNLELRDSQGRTVLGFNLTLSVGPGKAPERSIKLDAATVLWPGRHELYIIDPKGRSLHASSLFLTTRPLDDVVAENERRLSVLDPPSPALKRAVALCRARNALLSSRPSENDSAQFLPDPLALLSEVIAELEAIRRDELPYKNRAGDYWRNLPAGEAVIPLRLYAPEAVRVGRPLPLVIALHGAGGDESMFMESYGHGLIKQLADERGFIVAAPHTYGFGGSAENLERLLDDLGADYAIDPDRVYVLGHSLGAVAAVGFATARHERLGACCCIAGFRPIGAGERAAPTLVLAGELDRIFSVDGVRAAAGAAAGAGLPVELRVIENQGHTLIAGAVLPQAIDWLLSRRRGAAAAP